MQSVEVLFNILLVCVQAMKESDLDWPAISEEEQERQSSQPDLWVFSMSAVRN
jgi:hypothetical protein